LEFDPFKILFFYEELEIESLETNRSFYQNLKEFLNETWGFFKLIFSLKLRPKVGSLEK
jgi:hypothetical protein